MRIELMTSSLPRKRSTPELPRQNLSGKSGSNRPPTAWKAVALPNELFPLFKFKVRRKKIKGCSKNQLICPSIFGLLTLAFLPNCGERRIRTSEG